MRRGLRFPQQQQQKTKTNSHTVATHRESAGFRARPGYLLVAPDRNHKSSNKRNPSSRSHPRSGFPPNVWVFGTPLNEKFSEKKRVVIRISVRVSDPPGPKTISLCKKFGEKKESSSVGDPDRERVFFCSKDTSGEEREKNCWSRDTKPGLAETGTGRICLPDLSFLRNALPEQRRHTEKRVSRG